MFYLSIVVCRHDDKTSIVKVERDAEDGKSLKANLAMDYDWSTVDRPTSVCLKSVSDHYSTYRFCVEHLFSIDDKYESSHESQLFCFQYLLPNIYCRMSTDICWSRNVHSSAALLVKIEPAE